MPQNGTVAFGGDAGRGRDQFVARLKTVIPIPEIPIYELPPAIVTHGGPKTLGIGFFTDMV